MPAQPTGSTPQHTDQHSPQVLIHVQVALRGLVNLGVTCFLNALVQGLRAMQPFAELCRQYWLQHWGRAILTETWTGSLLSVLYELSLPGREAVNPTR